MNKAPAFQFYAQDFLTGVMYLTNEEKGIYITMLAKQWTDGKIPKKRLGFLVGLDWDKFSDELKEKFTDKGEYLVNERLEEERERKKNFLEKQFKNGKKGGRPPKNSEDEKPNLNPNKSQKKPLEDEDEIEEEKEVRKKKRKKGVKPREEKVVFPWETETFKTQWNHWKIYKKKEFKFNYKSIQSEQAALSELAKKSDGEEKTAIKIIHQSMSNGWKGFFELKNETNGKARTNKTNRELASEAMESETARNFRFK